mmetsp:Transcript_112804/g.318967  ORF Transcript_112804/g.318967 Transcript_112804/m.318967 type:complete len:464 (-) Transcript_112804:234-1625(-)
MAGVAAGYAFALLAGATCALVLQGCGGGDASTTTTTTTTPGSGSRVASEVVKVPGWPDITGKVPLSFAIKARGMVYASGMQGFDMHSMKLVEGGVKAETKQTLANLQELLKVAGSSMEDVVQCSVSLANITDFMAMNEAYKAFWTKDPPARVAVQVAALAGGSSVEIQCDAALKGHAIVNVPGFPDLSAKGIPLSFATKVDGMIFLSGLGGMNMSSGEVVPGGAAAETTQTLANLKQVLEAAGSSPDRVLGCSVLLSNMSDFAAMNGAYKTFWPKHGALGGLPSRVCVEVGALAGTGKVEIQCMAASSDMPAGEAPKVIKVPGLPDMHLPFSAGTTAGGMAYISGSQGLDAATGKLVPGGVGPETTQTLRNIQKTVEAAGTSMEDVAACEVSLMNMKDFNDMNKAYAAFWPKDPPSRIAVQVGGLAGGAAVEIKCKAALPGKAVAATDEFTATHGAQPAAVVV